jgi:hypothetical protein
VIEGREEERKRWKMGEYLKWVGDGGSPLTTV